MTKVSRSKAAPVKDEQDSTRVRILDVALKEFSKHGLSGARINAIAAESGINKGMIFTTSVARTHSTSPHLKRVTGASARSKMHSISTRLFQHSQRYAAWLTRVLISRRTGCQIRRVDIFELLYQVEQGVRSGGWIFLN